LLLRIAFGEKQLCGGWMSGASRGSDDPLPELVSGRYDRRGNVMSSEATGTFSYLFAGSIKCGDSGDH